jgi:arylsulfatase A
MKKIVMMACFAGLCGIQINSIQAAKQPNVLILYADDMGYGDLGVNNPASKIPTPHLDRLASEGINFTDGHSSSGICTPSRYALLTGHYHWRKFHGIVMSFGKSVFAEEELTLPEMMQEKGYHTAMIGKWHLGFNWGAIQNAGVEQVMTKTGKGTRKAHGPKSFDWSKTIPDGPTAHGFDYSFTDAVINFPPYCWIENDKVVDVPDIMMDEKLWKPLKEGNWECRPGPMATGWDPYECIPTLTKKAVKYIHDQAKDSQPFFLYFALPSPHAPIVPNDEFAGRSQAGPYGDFMVETDDACGRLLKALEASGQADNTIVIFTADNGPENYCVARDQKYDHWSSAPFRGLKRYIYEGGHHVPFVIKWPGVTKPGTTSDALISQIDIMATLASVVGYEIPGSQAEDSLNQLPVLSDPAGTVRTSTVHNTFPGMYGIRQGDWVLLNGHNISSNNKLDKKWAKKHKYPAEKQKNKMLYNLKKDIGQRNELSNNHPEKVEVMTKLLKSILGEERYAAAESDGKKTKSKKSKKSKKKKKK